ncbi:hypothetical protein [Erythrobacter sp. HL-111]|uniref:hypothetical protein n=1 Tax=Erythrobacter sp. HL-111 TaxID=1798193 RepID=UPI0006D9C800|nr:hypothetical protein [Erythrobacter sp. HL-111]KPP86893.1 MAG: hypothetical protein HLUCCO15_12810 [Erythrobacteraceae bacterium HL-111]SDS82555.1 hypothetical protein SAMN04515621_2310 [Erythrobacter sp. HL-111]
MLVRLAALAGLGYAGYTLFAKDRAKRHRAAYAEGEPDGPFRNAGADATRSKAAMSKQDEALDETYPASDATAKY